MGEVFPRTHGLGTLPWAEGQVSRGSEAGRQVWAYLTQCRQGKVTGSQTVLAEMETPLHS